MIGREIDVICSPLDVRTNGRYFGWRETVGTNLAGAKVREDALAVWNSDP